MFVTRLWEYPAARETIAVSTALLVTLAALGVPAAQTPSFELEPAIAGGYCARAGDSRCRALALGATPFDLNGTFGADIEFVSFSDTHNVFGQRIRIADGALTAPLDPVHDFDYAGVYFRLRRQTPPTEPWPYWTELADGWDADVILEVYRGDRSQLEQWLNGVRIPSADEADGCSAEEYETAELHPVYLERADFDGDSRSELVIGFGMGRSGGCSLTEVVRDMPGYPVLAAVGRAAPDVSVGRLVAPDGRQIPTLQLWRECCDLSQTFWIGASIDGDWAWLYRDDFEYAMWLVVPDGRRVLAGTNSLHDYDYGSPASLEGFTLHHFDGARLAEIPTPRVGADLGQTSPLIAVPRDRLLALEGSAEVVPPAPRWLMQVDGVVAWRAVASQAQRMTAWLVELSSDALASAARVEGRQTALTATRGRLWVVITGVRDVDGVGLEERGASWLRAVQGE